MPPEVPGNDPQKPAVIRPKTGFGFAKKCFTKPTPFRNAMLQMVWQVILCLPGFGAFPACGKVNLVLSPGQLAGFRNQFEIPTRIG